MNTYLLKAVRLAELNPIKPIGRNSIGRFAAILTNGKHEFWGHNAYTTHPLQKKFGTNDNCVHLHSEIEAILKVIRWKARLCGKHYDTVTDLSDYKMYVARVLRDGTPAMAKPCIGCQKAIMHFSIRSVEWTV